MSNLAAPESRRNTVSSVLLSVATLTEQRDREVLARSLVNTLHELIDCKHITLYRIPHADCDMEAIILAQTSNGTQHKKSSQVTSIIISMRKDFQAAIETGTSYIWKMEDRTYCSIYPLLDNQCTVGFLEIISNQTHSKTDTILISSFLKVYSNYLTILNESETDTLTGLLNRRTFENNLEKIIAEYSESQDTPDTLASPTLLRQNDYREHPHWLAVMDIDHFKRINDDFGHLYGDEVLLLLSRNMKRIFRQSDKLFRFGGEEFIVVLDRTSEDNAKKALERFREAIESYHFPQVGRITISIGFIRLDKADVPSSIIGRADQSLYYAKENGRNQVCFYEDLINKGKLAVEHYSDDIELF